MRGLRILPDVFDDVVEAAAWYDEQGFPGLGERFLDAFYARLPQVQTQGQVFPLAYHEYRKVWIKPFPYALYFRMHGDAWIVVLVIHAARSPELTERLLRERR